VQAAKQGLESLKNQARARAQSLKNETDAKIQWLKERATKAHADMKAQLERRAVEVRAD